MTFIFITWIKIRLFPLGRAAVDAPRTLAGKPQTPYPHKTSQILEGATEDNANFVGYATGREAGSEFG